MPNESDSDGIAVMPITFCFQGCRKDERILHGFAGPKKS
jgi:hypothetical protein